MPARQAQQHVQSALRSSSDEARGSTPHAHAVDAHAHAHVREVAATDPLTPHVLGVRISSRAERAATWLSLACAVHCLLMPIAISVMPLLGASGVTSLGPTAENALTLLVVASALAGVVWGYRRHRDKRVVYATGVGLAAYLIGHAPGHAFGEALAHSWYGMALAVLGALTLAGSSFLSARLSHACESAACAH